MKKYTKMVLAGVLLSSTVLGASTSVVQAASSNPLKVDTSSITNNVIQVINDLLGSKSTANKVNAQTQFTDLVDGSTLTATPIFGEKTASSFLSTLQGELNVVDENGQLVPITAVTTDSKTGFVTEVSYTLDGTTKKASVSYSLAKPTVSFSQGTTMNYTSADEANASLSKLVTAKTTNGNDAKGNVNAATLSSNPTSVTASGAVVFTPSDIYGSGIPATGTVNLYSAPTVPSRVVSTEDAAKSPIAFTANGQKFLATPTDTTDLTAIKYTVAAIDSAGNPVNDSATGNAITFTGVTGQATLTASTDTAVNYTMVFKDAKTGNVVFTKDATGKVGDTIDSAAATTALTGTDYSLSGDQSSTTLAQTTTEADFTVTKAAKTTVNYIDSITGKSAGTETLTGNNGSSTILKSIPTGYQLVNLGDFMQTLNADQPTKDIYVKPIQSTVGNLSYTVTYRDKTTGKVVGTPVKSEGALGDYIGLTAPDGYAFASIVDNGFLLLKNNQNVTKYVIAADTPYSISYVDQDTGKEVGTEAGKGADGSTIVLKAPTGYAFVSADDVNYTIDKDTPTSTVYVQKSDQTEDNIVSGYPKNGYIKIYNEKGKLNNDVVLSEGSSWIIDKSLTINGAEYYRVATNEYVKASDVYKYTPLQTVATTNSENLTPVYNSRGQVIIDRALDTNTPWYTDRSATIKGQKMYRVATDEWIRASDSTLK
ncbi:SLAP domain-containing protein [Companilactobacillus huachuanensis]|uniref:SLAP domain-containing protein n=1 Tax=Companilactobacillus huachuanensis TaxID=2559914 RepID=A0ABW1RNR8_9LACO|nr:SLAP domain-containing protein [Companilactobacillus huachuanensis]